MKKIKTITMKGFTLEIFINNENTSRVIHRDSIMYYNEDIFEDLFWKYYTFRRSKKIDKCYLHCISEREANKQINNMNNWVNKQEGTKSVGILHIINQKFSK